MQSSLELTPATFCRWGKQRPWLIFEEIHSTDNYIFSKSSLLDVNMVSNKTYGQWSVIKQYNVRASEISLNFSPEKLKEELNCGLCVDINSSQPVN